MILNQNNAAAAAVHLFEYRGEIKIIVTGKQLHWQSQWTMTLRLIQITPPVSQKELYMQHYRAKIIEWYSKERPKNWTFSVFMQR